jgi:adenylylsulfate kinase
MAKPGFAIWLTGLPASGKSSLAQEIQRLLDKGGIRTIILDSDDLRQILTAEPTYEPGERDWFYSVIVYLAAWLTEAGINVLIAATANRHAYRDQARERIARFAEVFVDCPLPICRDRDPKGIYALADQGQASNVPGIDAPYELPLNPEAAVNTGRLSPAAAARSVLEQLGEFVNGHSPLRG